MLNDFLKVFGIILVFFVFYLFFGWFCYQFFGFPNNTSDFVFHWNKLQGQEIEDYKPLFYLLMLPFSWNVFVFWLVNVSLILIVFPFLFYKLSGSWWGALIYFCGISLAHQQVYAATFPSAIVLLFFLVYWKFRPLPVLWFVFLVLSFFLHSYGVYLFLLVGVVELINFFWKENKKKLNWLELKKKLNCFNPGVFLVIQQLNNLKTFIGLFLSQLPLPVFFIGLFGLKDWQECFFVIVSFLIAIVDFRAIAIAQIFLGIGFAKRVSGFSKKFKVFVFIFLMFQLVFYLLDFVLGTYVHLLD